MANDNPKYKLWEALSSSQYYTKSFNDFDKQFSSPESISKLHGALNSAGYYTKSVDDFNKQFFFSQKKAPTQDLSSQLLPGYSQKAEAKAQVPYKTDAQIDKQPKQSPLYGGKKINFNQLAKDFSSLHKGEKQIKDFADPRLNPLWQETHANKGSGDFITNAIQSTFDFVGDQLPDRVKNAWERGKLQGETANILHVGANPTESDLRQIANNQRRAEQEFPQSKEAKEFNEAESGAKWIFSNPLKASKFIGETILESLSAQLKASERTSPTAVAVGAGGGSFIPGIGTGAGALTGLTAGQITAGINLENSSKLLSVLEDAGFPTKDDKALVEAFKDPELIDKAKDLAIKRGLAIGLVDLLTAGLAGKIGARSVSGVGRKLAKTGAVVGTEALGGSAGELAGQVVTGEKIDPKSILLEGLAEVGSGAPSAISETASTIRSRENTSAKNSNIVKQITDDPETGFKEANQNLDNLLDKGLISKEDHKEGKEVAQSVMTMIVDDKKTQITKEDATTEIEEQPTESSTEERTGVEEGQQEIGQTEWSQRQEQTTETDTSDSVLGSEEGKVRGFVESLEASPEHQEIAKTILENPESKYNPQNEQDIRDRISEMDEATKNELFTRVETEGIKDGEDNIGVAVGIDLANQYMNEGKVEQAEQIFTRLAKLGTGLGQLVRQFAGIKKVNPKSFVKAFENRLDKAGRSLTDEQGAKVEDLFNKYKEAKNGLDKATTKAELKKAEANLRSAGRNLDRYMKGLSPRSVFKTGESVLQGNFLLPKSLLQNPIANLGYQVVKTAQAPIETAIDRALSFITGTKTRQFAGLGRLKARGEGIIRGIKSAKEKSLYGTTDKELEKMGVGGGLDPRGAWERIFSGDSTAETVIDKVNEKASDLLEGTAGIPAEIMLRGLAWGDDPFKMGIYNDRLYVEGQLKGLEGEALEDFVKNPDKESQQRAEQVAEEGVLQDKNMVAEGIEGARRWLEKVDQTGFTPFLARSIAPYTKTPLNYLWQYVRYANPKLPMIQAMSNVRDLALIKRELKTATPAKAKKLNSEAFEAQRKLSENLATAVVGTIIAQLATQIIGKGIISGEPEEGKKRQLQYKTKYPNSINVSALERGMKTGDFSIKPTDEWRALNKFGVLGDVLLAKESQYKDKGEVEPQGSLDKAWESVNNLVGSFNPFLQQSFVKGLSNALDVFKKDSGGASKNKAVDFFTNIAKSMTHVAIPNTYTSSLRARAEYLPDFKGDTPSDNFLNAVKSQYKAWEGYPLRRDIWGEPIKLNQKEAGSLASYWYQLIDPTGERRLNTDPRTFEIFNLHQLSEDDGVIPTPPKDKLNKKQLTRKQFEELSELIGKERGELVDKVINNSGYESYKLDRKIDKIKEALKDGKEKGLKKFTKLHPEFKEKTKKEQDDAAEQEE